MQIICYDAPTIERLQLAALRQQMKAQPHVRCVCGRIISANKIACRKCVLAAEETVDKIVLEARAQRAVA